MKESSSLHDKMIDRNWVMKRKRKRVPGGLYVSKEKESVPLGSDSSRNKLTFKKKLRSDAEASQFSDRIKGQDGVRSFIS